MAPLLETKTKIGIGITFVILVLNGGLSYRSLRNLDTSQRSVAQAQAVVDGTEAVLSTMKDAETGVRGYLLTGDESYLQPHEEAAERIYPELSELQRLTADIPAQKAYIQPLGQAVTTLLDVQARAIVAKQRGDETARAGHGKALMDDLRSFVAKMEAEQKALVAQRASEVEANRRVAFPSVLATTLIAGMLVVTVGVVIHRDAVAQGRAERRASFIARSAAALSSSLDYRRALPILAESVVPEMADGCVVDLLEGGQPVQVAAAYADPAMRHHASELRRRYPVDTHSDRGVAGVLRTGRAEFTLDMTDEHLAATASDPEHLILLRELKIRSVIVCPMIARGRALGVITFFTTADSARRYEEPDIDTARTIAERAAIAVDHARLYQDALQASRIKDQFLATLSHELRTPLNAIVGWAHMLREGELDAEGTKKAIDVIDRNAKAQTQMIADALDVSRITSGKMLMNVGAVDFAAAIDGAVDSVRPAAEAKQVRLELILDPSAGAISGDEQRLQQVVWNLISNAVKFAPRGGHVVVRLEAINSHVELAIEDNGPGIDPEFLPNIFERFSQADSSSTRQHGGLGLGLAIARHIVELHGGTITAANRPERSGAIFTVRLPRRTLKTLGLDEERSTADIRIPATSQRLGGVRVLYVDDDLDSRVTVLAILERHGAHVTAVGSAEEALEAIRSDRPDVFLLDIEMPGTDGYELLGEIQRQLSEPPGRIAVAAVTGYASTQDRMNALAAGFRMHLPKPVDPNELIMVVANLAGRFAFDTRA